MRNVRNAWIDARIDGQARSLSGGPAARDGGIDADVLVRAGGSPVKAARLEVFARHVRDMVGTVRTSYRLAGTGAWVSTTTHRDHAPGMARERVILPGEPDVVGVNDPWDGRPAILLSFRSLADRERVLALLSDVGAAVVL